MKTKKVALMIAILLIIMFFMNACTDPTQKKLERAHAETEAAIHAAEQAQRSYNELIKDYEQYKQTQGKLG